jgi:hypothetical protein
MSDYAIDRNWSDKYIPLIKQTIGPYLLTTSSFELDTQRATDLITFSAKNLMIACRLRRPGALERFGWDFTIRSKRSNGCTTELTKIVDGWGDWFFYAHVAFDTDDKTEMGFSRWFIINLNSFRAQSHRDLYRRVMGIPQKLRYDLGIGNVDNATSFAAFDIRSFDPSILIASSEPVPWYK